MFNAVCNPFLVPGDGTFDLSACSTQPPAQSPDEKQCKQMVEDCVKSLDDLQQILYAHDKFSVLLIFQAMDAAGKDSTIRAVLRGVNPAGFQVFNFKRPSERELDHDFLWRTAQRLPERGRIGVFNRSYYEEVLVVQVHPQFLTHQKLPEIPDDLESLWTHRYQSILDHEKHLARNGTFILKFFLNVSKEEQKKRFLSRLDDPGKNWKFSAGDVVERQHWDAYMQAYQKTLNATSRPWAPWYSIPADNKHFMRAMVAQIIVENLKNIGMHYPSISPEEKSKFDKMRALLQDEA